MPAYTSRGGRKIWVTAAAFKRMNDLPYGKWLCADGREVLFNRFYEPIYERRPGDPAKAAPDPREWIKWTKQSWFYDDSYSPIRAKRAAEAALKDFEANP